MIYVGCMHSVSVISSSTWTPFQGWPNPTRGLPSPTFWLAWQFLADNLCTIIHNRLNSRASKSWSWRCRFHNGGRWLGGPGWVVGSVVGLKDDHNNRFFINSFWFTQTQACSTTCVILLIVDLLLGGSGYRRGSRLRYNTNPLLATHG